MLRSDLKRGTLKRRRTAKPFIDNDPQGVLITCRSGTALQLFWCKVERCSRDLLGYFMGTVRMGMLSKQRQTKVTEQDRILSTDEHIFRFDITVDQMLVMCVV